MWAAAPWACVLGGSLLGGVVAEKSVERVLAVDALGNQADARQLVKRRTGTVHRHTGQAGGGWNGDVRPARNALRAT